MNEEALEVYGMNEEALKAFLLAANVEGYAEGDARTWTRELDGSLTISCVRGPWRLHDNFFGGEPYGGREVVFYGDRPVWMLVYYGWVAPEWRPEPVYAFLKQALRRMPAECPLRGPTCFEDQHMVYRNTADGCVARFSGREEISSDGTQVYEARYAGGWVDVRQEEPIAVEEGGAGEPSP